MGFREIARVEGLSVEGARKRFLRAVQRAYRLIRGLREGDAGRVLREADGGESP